MPQREQVNSLFNTCSSYITNNIDLWRFHGGSAKYGCGCNFNLGSFEVLPSSLVKALCDSFCNGLNPPSSIFPLLTRNLHSLELDFKYDVIKDVMIQEDFHHLFHLMTLRCPELKSLKMGKYFFYGQAWLGKTDNGLILKALIPKLSKIQVLEISNTMDWDFGMQLLGKYCRDLRVLVLDGFYQSSITDEAIKALCVPYVDSDGVLGGQCRLIEKLDIYALNQLSKVGTKTALKNLPQLKILKSKWSVRALAEIHRESFGSEASLPKYSLTELHYTDSQPVERDGNRVEPWLRAFQLVEPLNITTVSVSLPSTLESGELLPLLQLKNLKNLEIVDQGYSNDEHVLSRSDLRRRRISYEPAIVSILQSLGKQLNSFKLDMFPVVNLSFIPQFCPNLERLKLSLDRGCLIYPFDRMTPPLVRDLEMINLKHLSIHHDDNHDEICSWIRSEYLDIFFSSPSLITIEIHGCKDLTDQVFEKASADHGFPHLESLQLYECATVTRRAIDVLMTESNPLRLIKLENCWGVDVDHADEWKVMAKRANWKTEIIVEHSF